MFELQRNALLLYVIIVRSKSKQRWRILNGVKMFMKITEEYKVGNEEIDSQHLTVSEIINSLHHDIESGVSIEFLMNSFDFLSDYTQEHFSHEEKLMADAGYNDLPKHKERHQTLISELEKMKNKFLSCIKIDGEEKFAEEFLLFLKDWWLTHIMEEDQKYSPYI